METAIIYLPARVDGDASARTAVVNKLKALGARIAGRLSRDVTHIVFLKKLQPTYDEQARQDALLRELYERLNKVLPSVFAFWSNTVLTSLLTPAERLQCPHCVQPVGASVLRDWLPG